MGKGSRTSNRTSGHRPAGFSEQDHLRHARRLARAKAALSALLVDAAEVYPDGHSIHQAADEGLAALRFLQGALDQTGRQEHGKAWRWVYLTAPRGTR